MPHSKSPTRVKYSNFQYLSLVRADLSKPFRRQHKRTGNRYLCCLLYFLIVLINSLSHVLAENNSAKNLKLDNARDIGQITGATHEDYPVKIKAEHRYSNLFLSELDWQHADDSSFNFTRFFNSANISINLGLGPGWQSNFHRRVLQHSAESVSILDADGKRLFFRFFPERSRWESLQRGHLTYSNDYLKWLDSSGTTYTFKGPYLVSLTTPTGLSASLHYHKGRLVKVKDSKDRLIIFRYSENNNSRPTQKQQSTLRNVIFQDKSELVLEYSDDLLISSEIQRNNALTSGKLDHRKSRYSYLKKNSNNLRLLTGIVVDRAGQKAHELQTNSRQISSDRLKASFDYDISGNLTFLNATYNEYHNLRSEDQNNSPAKKGHTIGNAMSGSNLPVCKACSDTRHTLRVFLPEKKYELNTENYTATWHSDADGRPITLSINKHSPTKQADPKTIQKTTNSRPVSIKSSLTKRDQNGIPELIREDNGHFYRLQKIKESEDPTSTFLQARSLKKSDSEPTNLLLDSKGKIVADVLHQDINRINYRQSPLHGSNNMPGYSKRQRRVSSQIGRLADILSIDHTARAYRSSICETGSPEFPINLPDLSPDQPASEEHSDCQSDTDSHSDPDEAPRPHVDFPGALQLDIRPENCSSYFDITHAISRGSSIENAIASSEEYAAALSTVRWFPAIDLVLDRTAIAQISRDLTAVSYSEDDHSLYDRLMREAQLISQNFIEPLAEAGEVVASDGNQTTRIMQSGIDNVRFELVIQRASISSQQLSQIERAALEMKALYGIDFRVVEIP